MPKAIEIFYHEIDKMPVKFSIWQEVIDKKIYYYAMLINTDLDSYKKRTEFEQSVTFGIRVTDGNNQVVYYSDPKALKADIIELYGKEWLKSEI